MERTEHTSPGMRISDAERQRMAELLSERCREGYLSVDTFERRLDVVYRAKTGGELEGLARDLPPRHRRLDAAREALRSFFRGPAQRAEASVISMAIPLVEPREGSLLMGRDSGCDIVLNHPTVSRLHAALRKVDNGWVLQDLASTNGVRVNGWPVREAVLRQGDRVTLGDLTVSFG